MGLFSRNKKQQVAKQASRTTEYDLAIFYNSDIGSDFESFVLNETFVSVCRENGLLPENNPIAITIATQQNLIAKGKFSNGEGYEVSYTMGQNALMFHFEFKTTQEQSAMAICISLAKILRWLGGGCTSINGLKDRVTWQPMLHKLSQEL